jgi:phage terminase Nu1 subunit (DNA packaging protein)
MATKKDAVTLVDVGAVAALFGCTDRHVQRFTQEGMPKAAHGKYDLASCAGWYIARLRQELDEERQKGGNLEFEQTRETKAKADIAELKAAQMRRELIPIDIYRQRVSAHHSVVRQNMLALPGQIAPQLEGLARIEIKTRLDKRIKDLLNSLATGKEIIDAANGNAPAPTTPDAHAQGADGGIKRARGRGARRPARRAAGHQHKRVGGGKSPATKRHK